MRNEIWSLISYFEAPSWFITFSPADNMHPISLYFADTQETFSPELRPDNERHGLISQNPVAGAQFFHFMVEMFIKHVLGVGQDYHGLYGKTAAYYGAVEATRKIDFASTHAALDYEFIITTRNQRLNHSDFQKKIVEYLESVHVGEFMTGTMDEVKEQIQENMKAEEYEDLTQTLPDPPPEFTDCDCEKCESVKIQLIGGKNLRIL